MYTTITNIETFDDSVLLNDNGSNNLQIELNDGTLINAVNYYDLRNFGFSGDNVNKFSHNAIKLPSGQYIVYYKLLGKLISKETIEDLLDIFNSINVNSIFDEFGNKAELKDINMLLSYYVEGKGFKIDFFVSKYKEHGFSNNDEYLIDMFLDI